MVAHALAFYWVYWDISLASLGLVSMALCFADKLVTIFHGLCLLPDCTQLVAQNTGHHLDVAVVHALTWHHLVDTRLVLYMAPALVLIQMWWKMMVMAPRSFGAVNAGAVSVVDCHIPQVNLTTDIWVW